MFRKIKEQVCMFSGMVGNEVCLQQSIELLIASSALGFVLYKRSEYLIYGERAIINQSTSMRIKFSDTLLKEVQ